jgi:hypothetical protein
VGEPLKRRVIRSLEYQLFETPEQKEKCADEELERFSIGASRLAHKLRPSYPNLQTV